MKRIIDIDEDYYEILKFNVENGQKYKPWEIIANSTPYEERPQGEWIYNDGSYKCGKCGHEIIGIPQDLNYCCKCGAKMTIG